MKKLNFLIIPGSLRSGSFTYSVAEHLVSHSSDSSDIKIADISKLPLFNQDLEISFPESALEFKSLVANSDAIIFVTPEHNYSISALLKNAIDWGSRPYGKSSFDDKPCAIVSASMGTLGGVRAQIQLRGSLVYLNMHPLNKPEIIIPSIHEKIVDGKIADNKTQEKLQELISALEVWTRRLQS